MRNLARPKAALLICFVLPLATTGALDGASETALRGGTDLQLVPLAGDFLAIVDIAHAGDDRLFLSEQDGQVRLWRDGVLSTFLDISGRTSTGFEGGIKSVAFHPDFANNGYFFVHYSDVLGDSVVSRFSVSAGDPDLAEPSSETILITVDQTTDLHRGGQLQFGPDGYLYIGFGDGGPQTDTECNSQRSDRYQGKLLRIDIDQNVPLYGIPAGNPFTGPPIEPFPEVWALGLRQPWRFSFDRFTGDLYIADVGQVTQEEIDFQPASSSGGENYGWRIMEGTSCHDPDPIDDDCPAFVQSCFDASYTMPAITYQRAGGNCSVTGGYVYRGDRIGQLQGRYLYGDWCSGRIWAARRDASGVWNSDLLTIQLGQVTTFGEDPDGNLYIANGVGVYRIEDPSAIFTDGFETGDRSVWDGGI